MEGIVGVFSLNNILWGNFPTANTHYIQWSCNQYFKRVRIWGSTIFEAGLHVMECIWGGLILWYTCIWDRAFFRVQGVAVFEATTTAFEESFMWCNDNIWVNTVYDSILYLYLFGQLSLLSWLQTTISTLEETTITISANSTFIT